MKTIFLRARIICFGNVSNFPLSARSAAVFPSPCILAPLARGGACAGGRQQRHIIQSEWQPPASAAIQRASRPVRPAREARRMSIAGAAQEYEWRPNPSLPRWEKIESAPGGGGPPPPRHPRHMAANKFPPLAVTFAPNKPPPPGALLRVT